MPGLFDENGFDQCKPRDPTEYVGPGDHVFEVVAHKYVPDHDAFVAELKALESKGFGEDPPHVLGSTVSLFVGNGGPKFAEANRREIKNYVRAVLGLDDVSSKVVMGTTTEDGQAAVVGRKVRCRGRMNAKRTYCKKTWGPVE